MHFKQISGACRSTIISPLPAQTTVLCSPTHKCSVLYHSDANFPHPGLVLAIKNLLKMRAVNRSPWGSVPWSRRREARRTARDERQR